MEANPVFRIELLDYVKRGKLGKPVFSDTILCVEEPARTVELKEEAVIGAFLPSKTLRNTEEMLTYLNGLGLKVKIHLRFGFIHALKVNIRKHFDF